MKVERLHAHQAETAACTTSCPPSKLSHRRLGRPANTGCACLAPKPTSTILRLCRRRRTGRALSCKPSAFHLKPGMCASCSACSCVQCLAREGRNWPHTKGRRSSCKRSRLGHSNNRVLMPLSVTAGHPWTSHRHWYVTAFRHKHQEFERSSHTRARAFQ